MFGWLKKPKPDAPVRSAATALRAAGLYGDLPLAKWARDGDAEPWLSFSAASAAVERGDTAAAREALERIVAMPDLESRHYLQAWHALRALGVTPPDERARHVHGVVVEVPMNGGRDTLAVYEDQRARFLSHAGSVIVWEHPDPSLDALAETLLAEARTMVARIGVWDGELPALPARDMRLVVLTPRGPFFGQGPMNALMRDPMAAPVIQAATMYMRALVSKTLQKQPPA